MKLPLTLPPATRAVDFIALGENSLDVVAVGGSALEPGSKHALETLGVLPGGQAATAAVACSRLGWRTRYIGCLGDDPAAERIAAALSREGVDARLIQRAGSRCRMAIVLIERVSGNRTILEYREPQLQLRPDEIDIALIASGRLLLVDATDVPASLHAARLARDAGMPTLIDVDRPVAGIEELLGLIDVIIVSADFPRAMTGARGIGEGLERLTRQFRPAAAIATLGSEGSVAFCAGREIRTPARSLVVRDTTGAGDAFRGGFAAGWLEAGSGADLERLLTYANAVAALNCRGVGAQTALPTRDDLAAIL